MFRMRENVQRATRAQPVCKMCIVLSAANLTFHRRLRQNPAVLQPGRKAFAARVELRYSNPGGEAARIVVQRSPGAENALLSRS